MNRSTETTAPDNSVRIARAAWLCAFVVPLLLATLLLGVKSTQAAPSSPPLASLFLDEEEEFEEEAEAEFAEEECAIAEEELEEGFLTPADVAELCTEADAVTGGASQAAEECPLRSARARAVERNDRLKVTIGYTATEPTSATVQIRGLGTFKRRLGRSGVLRFSKRTGKKQAKRIKVRIRVPTSAGGRRCGLVQVVANKVV